MDPARVFTAHRKVMFSEASRGVGQTLSPPPSELGKWAVHILLKCIIVTTRNEVGGKVIFSQASVILSTGGGRGVPGPGKRQGLRRGGAWQTPPPPDGYYCGRYASYWNAFLLCMILK